MQFDHSHKPGRDNLTPDLVALMDKAFYARRAAGFNVQFHHEDGGNLDEWSFKDRDQAEAFARRLDDKGIDHAFSA